MENHEDDQLDVSTIGPLSLAGVLHRCFRRRGSRRRRSSGQALRRFLLPLLQARTPRKIPASGACILPHAGVAGTLRCGHQGRGVLSPKQQRGPPLVEGDLFSSLFEGATSATYRPIVQKSDEATFEMEWTNDGRGITSPPEPFVWKDQVLLVRTPSGWRIADFAHLGTWEFMKKWPVSEILRDVAKECATGRQHNL